MRLLKQSTGEAYYEYVLLYIDDVLVISERAEKVLRTEIGQHFVLREESIGKPTNYLGEKLREVLDILWMPTTGNMEFPRRGHFCYYICLSGTYWCWH